MHVCARAKERERDRERDLKLSHQPEELMSEVIYVYQKGTSRFTEMDFE